LFLFVCVVYLILVLLVAAVEAVGGGVVCGGF
jgi:hypothetical protein